MLLTYKIIKLIKSYIYNTYNKNMILKNLIDIKKINRRS